MGRGDCEQGWDDHSQVERMTKYIYDECWPNKNYYGDWKIPDVYCDYADLKIII